jgi:hypothetical protein
MEFRTARGRRHQLLLSSSIGTEISVLAANMLTTSLAVEYRLQNHLECLLPHYVL